MTTTERREMSGEDARSISEQVDALDELLDSLTGRMVKRAEHLMQMVRNEDFEQVGIDACDLVLSAREGAKMAAQIVEIQKQGGAK